MNQHHHYYYFILYKVSFETTKIPSRLKFLKNVIFFSKVHNVIIMMMKRKNSEESCQKQQQQQFHNVNMMCSHHPHLIIW